MINSYTNIGILTINNGEELLEGLWNCGNERQRYELARAIRDASDAAELHDVNREGDAWATMTKTAREIGCNICQPADGAHNGAFLMTPDVLYYLPLNSREIGEAIYNHVRTAYFDALKTSFDDELNQ